MAKKTLTYDVAMKRLEEIVNQIENNELDIDSLASTLKEAEELIKFCREKLYNVNQEVNKILESNNESDKSNI